MSHKIKMGGMNCGKSIESVVENYMECGHKYGFGIAEFILMKHLPKNNPDGKCCDVLAKDQENFIRDLKRGPIVLGL